MRNLRLFCATLLAAASAPVMAQAPTGQVMIAPFDGTRLDIVATGESTRVPDLVMINAGVVTDAATAQEALTANNRQMQAVFDALRAAGIEDRDIQTSSISLSPRYDYENRRAPRLVGYQASNNLSIRFRELERAGPIIDALVSQGVNQINGPSLQIEEPEAALDEARRDALHKARARADLYASALGMRVVRVVAVSEAGRIDNPVIVTGTRMMNEAAADSMQIAPGEQRLRATVSVTYALQ